MTINFGYRLKELREERDLTMDELINDLNKRYPGLLLSKSVISRYENNKAKPKRFDIVEGLADYFGVTIGYLMGRSDDRYGDNAKHKMIPIVGTIAAGLPIFVDENILGYEYVSIAHNVDFCLLVKGDSMINARIHDGDLVFIRQQPDVENGEIAAVIIDGEEATLKRVYKSNGTVTLRPENPKYKDFFFSKKEMKDVRILGKAVYYKSEVR